MKGGTKDKPSRRWAGKQALHLRLELGMNQAEFWRRVYLTQSAGSRYESGRAIPKPTQALLTMAYGSKTEAYKELEFVRGA